jgi:hypothetical protein
MYTYYIKIFLGSYNQSSDTSYVMRESFNEFEGFSLESSEAVQSLNKSLIGLVIAAGSHYF